MMADTLIKKECQEDNCSNSSNNSAQMALTVRGKSRTSFSFADQQRLMDIALKYAHIIESKKTDKVTWKQKLEAWKKLAVDFNAGTTSPKTAATLQGKFRNMKRDYRARERQSLNFAEGGLQEQWSPYPFADSMEKLLEKGLDSLHQQETGTEETATHDSSLANNMDHYEEEENLDEDNSAPDLSDGNSNATWDGCDPAEGPAARDWDVYCRAMLMQPVRKELAGWYTESRSSSSPDNSANVDLFASEPNKSDEKLNSFKAARTRPSLKRVLDDRRSASGTYAELVESKRLLAESQINLAIKELAMKKERHAKEMELLDLKIQGEKLKLHLAKLSRKE